MFRTTSNSGRSQYHQCHSWIFGTRVSPHSNLSKKQIKYIYPVWLCKSLVKRTRTIWSEFLTKNEKETRSVHQGTGPNTTGVMSKKKTCKQGKSLRKILVSLERTDVWLQGGNSSLDSQQREQGAIEWKQSSKDRYRVKIREDVRWNGWLGFVAWEQEWKRAEPKTNWSLRQIPLIFRTSHNKQVFYLPLEIHLSYFWRLKSQIVLDKVDSQQSRPSGRPSGGSPKWWRSRLPSRPRSARCCRSAAKTRGTTACNRHRRTHTCRRTQVAPVWVCSGWGKAPPTLLTSSWRTSCIPWANKAKKSLAFGGVGQFLNACRYFVSLSLSGTFVARNT